MKTKFLSFSMVLLAALLMLLLLVSACGGDAGESSPGGGGIGGTGNPADAGTVRVLLTDAPACGFDAVNITVERVRIHESANVDEGAGGWTDISVTPPKRINLLDLSNGVLQELGQTSLLPGKYTQLRLVLGSNTAANPLANSVVPTGGAESALSTPSAQQSGIKVNLDLDVVAGSTIDLVLDFDACKSIVTRGASGGYGLKPVITAIALPTNTGSGVRGYVSPAIDLASTSVSVQVAGKIVKATSPDASGGFFLYPVPSGTYDLVVSSSGRVPAVVTGVQTRGSGVTSLNSSASPVLPPPASNRALLGSVSPSTGTLRFTQTLTGGPQVEVLSAAVDASTGSFAVQLPVEAPVKAAYATGPAPLLFVADPAAAGKYTAEAMSDGATQRQEIDASVPVGPISFRFP